MTPNPAVNPDAPSALLRPYRAFCITALLRVAQARRLPCIVSRHSCV